MFRNECPARAGIKTLLCMTITNYYFFTIGSFSWAVLKKQWSLLLELLMLKLNWSESKKQDTTFWPNNNLSDLFNYNSGSQTLLRGSQVLQSRIPLRVVNEGAEFLVKPMSTLMNLIYDAKLKWIISLTLKHYNRNS